MELRASERVYGTSRGYCCSTVLPAAGREPVHGPVLPHQHRVLRAGQQGLPVRCVHKLARRTGPTSLPLFLLALGWLFCHSRLEHGVACCLGSFGSVRTPASKESRMDGWAMEKPWSKLTLGEVTAQLPCLNVLEHC